jgi:hypothetical protein
MGVVGNLYTYISGLTGFGPRKAKMASGHTQNRNKRKCFKELDAFSGWLDASPGAWKSSIDV